MEGSKSDLIKHLASLVTRWSGERPLSWRQQRAFKKPMKMLGLCSMLDLEKYRWQACVACLEKANGKWVSASLREAWLLETEGWLRLIELGMACNDRPQLPRNRVHEEALVSHQALHMNLPRRPL